MKWVDVKAIPWRVGKLATRRFEWKYTDSEGQQQLERTKESWKVTWVMVGIHTYNWWWVKQCGRLACGCTRNPLTRRVIMYDSECEVHCSFTRLMREEGDR